MSEYNALKAISEGITTTCADNAHILEAAEARHQSRSPLLDHFNDAANIRRARRERRRYTSFRLRERYANVCGLQRRAVVCAVAAHENGVPEALKTLDDLVLLIRRHTREYLRLHQHLRNVSGW